MWTNSYSMEQTGEFLQEVRRSKGMTQAEFAGMLGISHATLSNIEQGKNSSTHTLERAIQHLGLRLVIVPKTAQVTVIENTTESEA